MGVMNIIQRFWFPVVMVGLFLTVACLRPLLPVDETRYMTVAWEMYLRQGWLDPMTLNFEPYHHKPPFLMWMINLSWGVFGVSRWAGLIPPIVASALSIYLTARLARVLFPVTLQGHQARVMMIMMASVPFLIYGTVVMFDFTVSMFVVLTLLALLSFVEKRQWKYVILMGLTIGMGVLAKGPVMYLYVLPVMLLAPIWRPGLPQRPGYYMACLAAVLLSIIPVLAWLIPVLMESSKDFAFWLVWNQTFGRVTGNFSASHVRPFYFYLPLIPVLCSPWLFFPAFWRGAGRIKNTMRADQGVRFLLCFIVPVFLAFSVISGKQEHYMVPLLPGAVILIALALRDMRGVVIARVFAGAMVFFVVGHIVAARVVFPAYDLGPVAQVVRDHPVHDWAWVRNYHGEVGFLGHMKYHVDEKELHDMPAWFAAHPDGLAIIRYENPEDVAGFTPLMTFPYRSKNIGVFSKPKP